MFKYKLIAFILLSAVLASGKAYCQTEVLNPQIITVDGKVTKVDPEGGVIHVQTAEGNMLFHIHVEARLFRDTMPIASIDIERGDPVTIQYDSSSPDRNIITLVDHQPNKF